MIVVAIVLTFYVSSSASQARARKPGVKQYFATPVDDE